MTRRQGVSEIRLTDFGETLHLGGALAGDADFFERHTSVRGSVTRLDAFAVVSLRRKLPRLLSLPQLGAHAGIGEEHDQLAGDF
ncbi:hypothetical protein NF552_03440 [Roseomonas mucosa]|nr:hypothetical protein NF552_03440 [Roseomonas mucosa]